MLPRPTEEQLHIGVASWLRIARPRGLWWHTPNGGRRSKREAARFKAMGVLAGVLDLAFLRDDGALAFVELKRAGERPTQAQLEFIGFCEAAGVPCAWLASDDLAVLVDGIKRFLERHGFLSRA